MRLRLAVLSVVPLAVTATLALGTGHADPPPGGTAGRRHALADCLAAAERAYPGLVAASHKIGASRAQLDEAWLAPFFPVNATGFLSFAPEARGNPTFSPDAFGQNPFTGSYSYVARGQLETGVPISPWSWVRLGRVRDAARAGLRVSQEEHTKARLELRMNVRKAYYGLQFARDARYLLDQGQHYLDEADSQVRAGLDAGSDGYSPNDLHRMGVVRYTLRARRRDTVAGEQIARTALGALTGLGDTVDIVDEPLCPMATSLRPLGYYLTRAQASRPDVHMLAAGVEARRAARDVQQWAYLPDLALGLTAAFSSAPSIAEQANPFAANSANFAYWGAGVALRWTFEPLTNAARVRRLSEELAMTEAQQRLALGAIGIEVNEIYQHTEAARGRAEDYAGAEGEAYAWLTAVFQQYQAGTGDTGGLLIPLQQYLENRFNHLQAVYDMDKFLADLALATGSDEVAGSAAPGCLASSVPVVGVGTEGNAGGAQGTGPTDAEINRLIDDTAAGPGSHTDAGIPEDTVGPAPSAAPPGPSPGPRPLVGPGVGPGGHPASRTGTMAPGPR